MVSPEDDVHSSSRQVGPQPPANDSSVRWRPNVSTSASGKRSHFAPLSAEEELTYRRWRRATLAFYGVFLCAVAAIAIAIGPSDRSGTAEKGDLYSALASAVQRHSH